MKLTAEEAARDVTVLRVQGDVDGETYGALMIQAQQLVAGGTRRLVIDLTLCDYMSSAGLMVFTTIFKQMRDMNRNQADASWATKNVLDRAGEWGAERELVLVGPSPDVQRVLNMAGIPAYISIYPGVKQALTPNQDNNTSL